MNKAKMTTYNMRLKVKTPTFIGGGEGSIINKSQYIFDAKANKLHIMDERKLSGFLGKTKLLGFYLEYVKQLNVRGGGRGNSNQNNINIVDWFEKYKRMTKTNGDLKDCIKYTIDVTNIQKNMLNDVALFIKNVEGQPYIPGSSIKGSITNAILVHYITQNKAKYRSKWNEIVQAVNERNPSQKKKSLNRIAGDVIKEIVDINVKAKSGRTFLFHGMSGISISDSQPIDRSGMKLIQRKDLLLSEKGENKLPIFRECLVNTQESSFSITIDPIRMANGLGLDFGIHDLDDLFAALKTQYDLLAGEDGLFRVFPQLDGYLPNDLDESGFLFLGGGTGYLSKTIMAALAPDKDLLLKAVRLLLHNDRSPTYMHKNDRIISPRTLKVSELNGKHALNGICKIEVEKGA